MKQKKLVIANWKMNPQTPTEANKLFDDIKHTAARLKNVQTVICPPYVFLDELVQTYTGNRISFGAQDVFWDTRGAYTGEISPTQLKSIGVDYVIVGHSERRALGETDEMANKKMRAALKQDLTVIFCFGERERDTHGSYLGFLESQLTLGLSGISKRQLSNIVITYEPIWAIGKSAGEAMKPDDVHQMVIFIRKVLAYLYDAREAHAVSILYGGSVEPGNVESILLRSEVSGFLVGHASLKAPDFNSILETVDKAVVS